MRRRSPLLHIMSEALCGSEWTDSIKVAVATARRLCSGELDARQFALDLFERGPDQTVETALWGGLRATYFIRMDVVGRALAPVKIGSSDCPRARIEALATGSPYGLSLLASFPALLLPEHATQEYFRERCIRREWFRDGEAIQKLVREIRALSSPPSFLPEEVILRQIEEVGVDFRDSSVQRRLTAMYGPDLIDRVRARNA